MGEENKYTPTEESYARSFYRRLSDPDVSDVVAKSLGGRPRCSRTGNKVFIDCGGVGKIESILSFHEFDGRCIKLELQMETKKDGIKKTENFELLPCVDKGGPKGRISEEKLFKNIIEGFYVPSIEYFRSLHKLSGGK